MKDTYGKRNAGRVWLEVIPLTFGRARLVVLATEHAWTVEDGW